VPRLFDRSLDLQKPPLYYWLVAFLGWLHGGAVDAWAVRLPAALCAVASVLFVWYVGKRSGRARAGLLAAFVLASFVHFTWLARVGRIDMPLTLTVTLALGSLHISQFSSHPRRWHALAYAAVGIGLLFKGPIALALPAVVLSLSSIVARFARSTDRVVPGIPFTTLWWGVPLLLLIASPWYLLANAHTDHELWNVFFWHHNLERGLGGSEALAAHPWWFYVPRAAIDLLPWSLVIPIATYGVLRHPSWRADAIVRMGLIWFCAILMFLSFMSFKRADYLLPAYPGMAMFLGACLDERPRTTAFVASLAAILLVYLGGWMTYTHAFANAESPYRAMAEEIRRQTHGPIVFFRAESHVLAYHLGRPVPTILEWENLDVWAKKSRVVYFVMSEDHAIDWQQHVASDSSRIVVRSSHFGVCERPLVVLRNR
jgi:4-amino-4-deoxy-L-arabinose transferase-like glycosyltransferase